MSTVRANNYYDASGGSAAQLYGVSMRNGGTAFVNRIINGDCRIDQRNAGASVTPTSSAFTYTLDRWNFYVSQASKLTTQQNAGSVTPPAGFRNYLGVTSSSAYSITSSDLFSVQQVIEGFNVADLAWGTASAQTVTLSFWVRSSLTGTFGGAVQNTNSGANRSYPFTYAISAANTWEYKTVTIPGDTTGTWGTTNSDGMALKFGLGVGSTFSGTAGAWAGSNFWSATGATSVVGTNGATFYITGVQLEAGTVASPFERVEYGAMLRACQRYCLVDTNDNQPYRHFATGYAHGTTGAHFVRQLPVPMRSAPSVTVSGNTQFLVDGGTSVTTATVTDTGYASQTIVRVSATVASGLTVGQAYHLASDGASSRRSVTYSAEL